MLSNTVVALQEGLFLAAYSDESHSVGLVSTLDPLNPAGLLRLERQVAFRCFPDGELDDDADGALASSYHIVKNTTGTATVPSAATTNTAGAAFSGQVLSASCEGTYVLIATPFHHRHAILECATATVHEFLLPHDAGNLLSSCWHPDRDDMLLLLTDTMEVLCLGIDTSAMRQQFAPSLVSRIAVRGILQRVLSSASVVGPDDACQLYAEAAADLLQTQPIVAIAMVPGTVSLPSGILLLLSRRGDVFSAKLDAKHMDLTADGLLEKAIAEERALRRHVSHLSNNAASAQEAAELLRLVNPWSVRANASQRCTDTIKRVHEALHREEASLESEGFAEWALASVHHLVRPPLSHGGLDVMAISLAVHCIRYEARQHAISILCTDGTLHVHMVHENDLLSGTSWSAAASTVVTLSLDQRVPSSDPYGGVSSSKNGAETESRNGSKRTSSTSTASSVQDFRGVLRANLMVSRDNLILVKLLGATAGFLVALPTWDESLSAWVYLSARQNGHSHLPVAGHDADCLPSPVAIRLPLDLHHYSVALDAQGTLVCSPCTLRHYEAYAAKDTDTKGADLRPLPTMLLSASEFLEVAIKASSGAFTLTGDVSPASMGGSGNSNSDIEALLAECSAALRHVAMAGYSDGGCGRSAEEVMAAAAAPQWLAADAALNKAADMVEAIHKSLHVKHTEAVAKAEAVATGVSLLRQRAHTAQSTADDLYNTLNHAIYTVEGEDEVLRVNRTLGDIHKALNELQRCVEAASTVAAEKGRESQREELD